VLRKLLACLRLQRHRTAAAAIPVVNAGVLGAALSSARAAACCLVPMAGLVPVVCLRTSDVGLQLGKICGCVVPFAFTSSGYLDEGAHGDLIVGSWAVPGTGGLGEGVPRLGLNPLLPKSL
jgi:hypothetical protein